MNFTFQNVANWRLLLNRRQTWPPSPVQPNLALSIKDIYSRFLRRQPLPDVYDGFSSPDDLSDFDNLSKIDKAAAAKHYAKRVATLDSDLKERSKKNAFEQAAARHRKSVADEVAKELAKTKTVVS
ncbi:hypothetical protein [Microviridae Bog9017_22]|uniref:hypothetical protein n=1 Tax=Microviridae Bog9017_22 TaxID=1655651 RepID=UPI00063D55FC|nr:hypothetical protein [Microviridae Bog9017_22]AKI26896.1 hypothetical protein [Microviridae Bog9017_22]